MRKTSFDFVDGDAVRGRKVSWVGAKIRAMKKRN